MPFKPVSPLTLSGIKSTVVVTAEMKEAYEFVTSPDKKDVNILCLVGGPGCGKTTTLVWLLKQLEIGDQYKPVTGVLGKEAKFSTDIADFSVKHVLLIDLNNAMAATVQMITLVMRLLCRFHRVVFAVSSGFISKLESDQSVKTRFMTIFRCGHKIRCKQFTMAEAQTLAKELRSDISAEEIKQLVMSTKGVPRLLCSAFVDFERRAQIIEDATQTEFTTAIMALPINSKTPTDVKILLACYFKISLRSVNLTLAKTKSSILLKANLVHIETEDLATVPHCYFHIDESLIELLSTHLCVRFNTLYPFGTVSTKAGLGDVFEGAFPTILSGKMDICVCHVHSNEGKKDVRLKFKNTIPLLYDNDPTHINEGYLYATPTCFGGINFLSLQSNTENLPAETLVGIQITIQKTKEMDKVQKTLQNFPPELHKHFGAILVIIINPNWVDQRCFDLVYSHTSSGRVKERYSKWYYGELCDFEPLLALLRLLLDVHEMP